MADTENAPPAEEVEGEGEEFDEAEELDETEDEGFDEMEVEEEPEDDRFSLFSGEEDDIAQKEMYTEYIKLIDEIDEKNLRLASLKGQLVEWRNKEPKNAKEKKEFERLLHCMEEERKSLDSMLNRAMQLQNFGSRRRYGDLTLETNMQEDEDFANVDCRPSCHGPNVSPEE